MSIGGSGADENNLIQTDSLDFKKFSILKIFRIFRVFRVLKVLRKLKQMRKIVDGISKSLVTILYAISFLFLFIIIFILLGMSLLYQIPDFKEFLYAFYIVFWTLTKENWNTLVYNMTP